LPRKRIEQRLREPEKGEKERESSQRSRTRMFLDRASSARRANWTPGARVQREDERALEHQVPSWPDR
jgi:hypothetical protein